MAQNETGIVYKVGDKVHVNCDGVANQQGWRMAEICCIDKAVFIFI